MSEKRILCVGMCVLDVIHLCAEFPQEDTDRRCLDGYWQRGGNASNNCSVFSKLGAKCDFLGMISSAPAFQFLYEDCKQSNIGINNCPKSEMNPPFSSVLLVTNKGSRTIIHANTGFPILKFEDFRKISLCNYSWIHFEGRNVDETKQMLDMIRNYNNKENQNKPIKISVELEKLNEELFILAMRSDIVFIGKDMAQHMGWSTPKEAVYNSRKLISDWKVKIGETFLNPTIICPWGSQCTDALDGFTNEYFSVKAALVTNVIDSLGAGDTFVAAVIFAFNNLNKDLLDAIDFGNQLAAFKIQHRGYDCVENFTDNSYLK